MPHGWRSRARWLGSPNRWRPADGARRRTAILRAFVDRTRIDWSAALCHARDADERTLVEGLSRLDALRGRPSPHHGERTPDLRLWPLATATAVAMAQVVCVLALTALALADGTPALAGSGVHLALALAFAGASLLLGAPALRDDRAFLLLSNFVLAATAFAPPLLEASAHGDRLLATPLFSGLYPEVFASAAAWELAVVFPSVNRFTAFDVYARRAASVAWIVAAGLCAANLLLAYYPGAFPVDAFERNHPGNLYWRIFAATELPAVAVILLRAHRAPRLERLKVVRFAGAIAAGAGPFLIVGTARSVPSVDAYLRSLDVRSWMDPILLVSLGALPVLTSIAVLVDDPFEPAAAVDGGTSRIGRWHALSWNVLARPFRQRRLGERLSIALNRLRLARGSRELVAVLDRELSIGAGCRITIVDPSELPADTALVPLIAAALAPIDLSRDRELFLLLPRHDRQWLDANGIQLVAAVRLRDGAVAAIVLIGQPRTGEAFDPGVRWFIGTLVTAAAAAWPLPGDPADGEDHADECQRCGVVRSSGQPACCPGAATRLASLPRRLAGKYTISRSLGSGGMGVVYLGHDEVLDRDVALKTLPGLSDGAVPRLRAEARLMAALSHPAIATIFGVEIWRGTPVLVVEYFPRGTLADALARERLPADTVVRLGIRLADALVHMHARGVLHRDIKPSNIGLTEDGDAKLLDFGLAGVEEWAAGTPAYLPPEVLAGSPPDAGVDLWALGVVLREACAPDDRLSAFLTRALARRREARFQSAREMADALRRVLAEG